MSLPSNLQRAILRNELMVPEKAEEATDASKS
jgi:hypothetical protein